jgi:murein tripeptide amidase MpaA
MPEKYIYDQTRYFTYDELTTVLSDLTAAHPDLVRLSSIGQSIRGREIWLLEITAPGRPAAEKPGYYIDANTHAEEVAGTQVALYTAWYLTTQYGQDAWVTGLLERQAFYIVPRLDPDGAEVVLTMPTYEWIGNGRYLPGEEQLDRPGLHYADVNGDGLILDMRWPDPAGEWKISDQDPRLLVRRDLDDMEGPFYRVIPEGHIRDFDGAHIPIPRPEDGNLNRNYPADWAPESQTYGAGQHAASEPEIAATLRFIESHPSICGVLNYHTNAGCLLPPFSVEGQPLPWQDAELYERIGALGERITGYGFVASEEKFNFRGAARRRGTSEAYLYGHLGLICLVTELWDVHKEAGIAKDWFYPLDELSEGDNLKLLAWNDRMLSGEAFVPWMPFDHPQLGRVELGGWRRIFMFRNPPGKLLPELCHKNALYTLKHAALAPDLCFGPIEVTPLGADTFRVSAVVENRGFLPTHLTQQAVEMKAISACRATLEADQPPAVAFLDGAERDLGHLAGWGERSAHYSRFKDWNPTARRVTWLVQLRQPGPVTLHVVASAPKGGTIRGEVVLG